MKMKSSVEQRKKGATSNESKSIKERRFDCFGKEVSAPSLHVLYIFACKLIYLSCEYIYFNHT